MERLFQTHMIRKQECLDGLWDFQVIDTFERPAAYQDHMAVPGCWETSLPYCRHRGFAAYRKQLHLSQGGNLRFVFKGVSHTCKVFLDSEELGEHYNAFSAFSLIAPGVTPGEHTLEVLVDNSFSERSMLHRENDYFTYGGIIRPVWMEWVPDQFIERLEFEPRLSEEQWSAELRVFLKNLDTEPCPSTVTVDCAGAQRTLEGSLEPETVTCLKQELTFEQVLPWSVDTPNLYLIKAVINGTDDLQERVGFRVIGKEKGKITLNGEPVFIKGVNRHEDHGSVGCAIPLQLMQGDIALIKELGCNAVRTCHYQNDERFLDLCDEQGILVWEESHERSGKTDRLTTPLWQKQSMDSMHQMLEDHYNHPSIILWGCLNECPSNEEACREIYETHLNLLKTDASRPCTYASCKHRSVQNPEDTDLYMELADVCSINVYPLWYIDETPAQSVGIIKDWLKEIGQGQKPLIISEYGAGAIYNLHDPMHPRWSEEYQSDCLEAITSYLLEPDVAAGFFIWQFCDTKVSWDIKGQRQRPGCRNNKGLVDEYRRPKMAYYTVQKLLKNL